MSSNILETYNINKTFGGVCAVNNFDFMVKSGEIHCLVGQNGCGKSTFMKIIAGVINPDRNPQTKIIINGKVFAKLNPRDSMTEGIEVIYQDLSLFPNLSVAENITMNQFIMKNRKIIYWKEMNDLAKRAIEKIKAKLDVNETLENYSIAKQQLTAICRAIATEVKLLIMDEPTASLGKSDVENLLSAIKHLKNEGVSILFVGHKLDEVLSIADRVTVMRDGKNIRTFNNVKELKMKQLAELMTGRELNTLSYKEKHFEDNLLLKIVNLTKKGEYENINFELFSGDILGIIGLVGAGRTELISSIFGLTKPDSGRIFIDGKHVKINTPAGAVKYGIGLVPEDRLTQGVFMAKSIEENISVTTIKTFRNKLGFLNFKKMNDQSNSWVNKLNIKTPSINLQVKQLSGGNQQRVVIAKWLATHPRILFLDGPTNGVDVGAKVEIHSLIQELADKGIGIIMVTDEVLEVIQYSTRIIVMGEGKFIKEFSGNSVDEETIKGLLK